MIRCCMILSFLFAMSVHSWAGNQVQQCNQPHLPEWFISKYGNKNGVQVVIAIRNMELAEHILTQKKCACEDLFPVWDSAIETYENDFTHLNTYAAFGTTDFQKWHSYHEQSQSLVRQARILCDQTGVH